MTQFRLIQSIFESSFNSFYHLLKPLLKLKSPLLTNFNRLKVPIIFSTCFTYLGIEFGRISYSQLNSYCFDDIRRNWQIKKAASKIVLVVLSLACIIRSTMGLFLVGLQYSFSTVIICLKSISFKCFQFILIVSALIKIMFLGT